MEFVKDNAPRKRSSGFVGSLVWAGILTIVTWELALLGQHHNRFFQPLSGWLASIFMQDNAFLNFGILWLCVFLVFFFLQRLARSKAS